MGTERSKSSLEQAIHLVEKQRQLDPQFLLVLVGPTASGKTALALELAKHFPLEIVSADSRLLYKGMDIGTAKPSMEEQAQVPHHLIDILDPDQSFSAAQFQDQAISIINDILKRGKLPLLVGGTMLYIDAVVYNYQWPEEKEDRGLKEKWRKKTLEELQREALLVRPDIDQWIDTKNPVRLQRVLMHHEATGKWLWEEQRLGNKLWPTLILGLNPDREILKERIAARVELQWQQGLVSEVRALLKKFDTKSEAFSGIGYRQVIEFLTHTCSEVEAKAEVIRATNAYAKRQMTWWKRNQDIVWL